MATAGPCLGSTVATSPEAVTWPVGSLADGLEVEDQIQNQLGTKAVSSAVPMTFSMAILCHENGREAWLHHPRQPHHIPIRKAQAAVAFRFLDRLRLTGPMDPVMLLRKVEPGHADRAIRPGRELL